MCLSTISSLTSILGISFREAPDLLKRHQLLFFWRANRSNNDVVTKFFIVIRVVCGRQWSLSVEN